MFIQMSAERILRVAHELGNPLGLWALEPEGKSYVSIRSEQRYIEKKAKQVTRRCVSACFRRWTSADQLKERGTTSRRASGHSRTCIDIPPIARHDLRLGPPE
jgi:hypothetical protein